MDMHLKLRLSATETQLSQPTKVNGKNRKSSICYTIMDNANSKADHPSSKRQCEGRISLDQKLRFATNNILLNTVDGINNCFNEYSFCLSEVLNDSPLITSAHFNYLFDLNWFMRKFSSENRKTPILCIHGLEGDRRIRLHEMASLYENIKLSRAKVEMFGTHHSKMSLLLSHGGFRVAIYTSNFISQDWKQKTQGAWISNLLPALNDGSTDRCKTNFKERLISYLTSYKLSSLNEWIEIIKRHDFSSVNVNLVCSVPGKHTGSDFDEWGHLSLRKLLKVVPPSEYIVGQFSSIGSLGSAGWMTQEFLKSLSTNKDSKPLPNDKLRLIFPSVENVRWSLEGYSAGESIPYSMGVAQKQEWLKTYFYRWCAEKTGRCNASPHIKTYTGVINQSSLAWFLLTSANLSKAAWGSFNEKNRHLYIRSYEIGVLVLPDKGKDLSSDILPWDLPLTKYSPNDQPWVVDKTYLAEDSHGKSWIIS